MRLVPIRLVALITSCLSLVTFAHATSPHRTVSPRLFGELEEASRLVAIAYCVGNQGIEEPFICPGWCESVSEFELVETWDLGFIDSTSCGYVALAHGSPKRIVVAFRGSNSLSDAVYDLLTQPAEYADFLPDEVDDGACQDCKVHAGFMYLWNATRGYLVPAVSSLRAQYPEYELDVLGHSLGGALAGLAALEFDAKGWKPVVTTFGEPRFGNEAMAAYVDHVFDADIAEKQRYRRVTHTGDPVPLLPFNDWGWRMHSGEIHISKDTLPAQLDTVWHCDGPSDPSCIRGPSKAESSASWSRLRQTARDGFLGIPGLPTEWKLWEILFAHRQYFWRIGLCNDPQDLEYPALPDENGLNDEL